MIRWLSNLFRLKPPVETVCVNYMEGDRLLRSNEGWRLSPCEDRNRTFGIVYLERDAVTQGASDG